MCPYPHLHTHRHAFTLMHTLIEKHIDKALGEEYITECNISNTSLFKNEMQITYQSLADV